MFWKRKKPKCLTFGSEKTEMFSCSSTEGLKKHNCCQSPLQWQSSPLCQVQACCFTCLSVCLVMVRPRRRLPSPKSVTEMLVTFLVMHFQRALDLQRGVAHNDRGSSALLCVSGHCISAAVQGLPADVFRAVAAHQSLSGAGRGGQSPRGSARYSLCQV